MFWYPLQSKKWAPTTVLPLLMWQKLSHQSRNLEMLYWKLFHYSGTTFIQALMLISRITRITSEGLNNLHSYTQTDGKVSAPFPMHKSSSSAGFLGFRIDPNIYLLLSHQWDSKNPPNIWLSFSMCFFLLPCWFRMFKTSLSVYVL